MQVAACLVLALAPLASLPEADPCSGRGAVEASPPPLGGASSTTHRDAGSYGEGMHAPQDSFWTVDRFEDGDRVVLEGAEGATLHVPRAWLPRAAREGHVLRLEIGSEDELEEDSHASELRFVVDEVETQQRLEEMQDLRDLLPDGPEGDLEL